MLKRTFGIGVLAAGLSFLTAAPGSAQVALFGGGGATFPTGDFGDVADAGWLVNGGFGIPAGDSGNAVIIGEVLWGGNSSDLAGDWDVFGGMAHLEYLFYEEGEAGPWILGGVGTVGLGFDPDLGDATTDWQAALNAGGGFSVPLGNIEGWLAGRYLYGFDDAQFFNIQAGLTIFVGGGGM